MGGTTQLSLCQILPRLLQGRGTGSQEDGAARNPESGACRSLVRGWRQAVSQESGGNGPCPKATQLSYCHPLSLPRPLYSGLGT